MKEKKECLQMFFICLCCVTIISCVSADQNSTNNSNNTDSHDEGVTTCTAEVLPIYPENSEQEVKCKVIYTSFNGGVCSTQVFDNIELCNQQAEEIPEIQVEDFNLQDDAL